MEAPLAIVAVPGFSASANAILPSPSMVIVPDLVLDPSVNVTMSFPADKPWSVSDGDPILSSEPVCSSRTAQYDLVYQ